MKPRTARRIGLINAERRERVARVVAFMDAAEGYGWKRRMEARDRFLDQDCPTMWLSGRKLVSRRNLLRLEAYAARFGFVPPAADAAPSRADVRQTLDALCK